jgi:signal transduction histidine kinase
LQVFGVLVVLAYGQAMIRPAFPRTDGASVGYALAMAMYWAVVAALFCIVYARQRRRVFDRPMRQLSAAAGQVAAGDFTVRLAPTHGGDRWDYVDVMFDDFNTMVAQLGSIEALKEDFIADVSHEIKTPLAVIANYADALAHEGRLAPERRADYLRTITRAAGRAAALVANILALDKLGGERITPAPRLFDLARQLAETALPFAEAAQAKGVGFSAELEDAAPVRADEGMLEIVWRNLLSNAVKFTPPGGTVVLAQVSRPGAVTVTVADTGWGMDQATQARVFDKFYQGETAAKGEGNGLGLALARRAAQLAGASIRLDSAPGVGSVFTVTLPCGGGAP